MREEIPHIETDIQRDTLQFPANKVECFAISDPTDILVLLTNYWMGGIPSYTQEKMTFKLLYDSAEAFAAYGNPQESTWIIIDQVGRVVIRYNNEYEKFEEIKQIIYDLIQ